MLVCSPHICEALDLIPRNFPNMLSFHPMSSEEASTEAGCTLDKSAQKGREREAESEEKGQSF